MNDIEYWKRPEVVKRKTEELRRLMRKATLPDVAEYSGIPLHELEDYLMERKNLTQKVWDSVRAALVQADRSALRSILKRDNCLQENKEEWDFAAYDIGAPGNVALIVRFSEEDWEKITEIFDANDDIESCLRSFLLKALNDDIKRELYCSPRVNTPHSYGLTKRGPAAYLFELCGCKIAVELDAVGEERIKREASECFLGFDECVERIFTNEYRRNWRESLEKLEDEKWKDKALYYKEKYEELLYEVKGVVNRHKQEES